MTCLSTALPPAAPCPPSLLQSPAHTHSPARFGTCPALSLCHKAAQTASTSSAAAPAPATAPASAAEGSSHSSPLALHAGGLVVVLPAALVLVVRVPACSRRGTERQEGCYRGKTAPWIKPAALGALWMHKKVWVPPRGRGRRAGSQPERPPFSSPRLLEGCLCCSFCRLFREAVLSRGTSDFMSICKGTHLCLLPAKGQNLGVTQVQRADTSTPQTLSSTHTVWGAAGPFEPNLSLDIPQGLAVTKTVRGAPRGC